MTSKQPAPWAPGPRLRELVAITVWLYAIVKLVLFDIDRYLLGVVAPGSEWILNLKFLALASALAALWLLLGHRRFALALAYIAFYPFVLVFWKGPKRLWRHWAFILLLLPAMYNAVLSLRSTFVLYTLAFVSTATIALSRQPLVLSAAMIALGCFLVAVMFRAFRRAHSASLFSQLAQFVRSLLPKIESGSYDEAPAPAAATPQRPPVQDEQAQQVASFPQLYLLHSGADFIAQRVARVAKDRRYNTLLVGSLLSTFIHAALVFGFENWALHRIDPAAFSGAGRAGFMEFLAYSLGQLATSNLTTIQPTSPAATWIAAAELLSSVLILVIGAFSILTAARDTYREDLRDFSDAVHQVALAIDHRIQVKYSVTPEALELQIAASSLSAVNLLRRFRGLPELPPLSSAESPPSGDEP